MIFLGSLLFLSCAEPSKDQTPAIMTVEVDTIGSYPIQNIIDGNPLSFFKSSKISNSNSIEITIHFSKPMQISKVIVSNLITEVYAFGSMTFLHSIDSPDGNGGSWEILGNVTPSSNNFDVTELSYDFNTVKTSWFKLILKNNNNIVNDTFYITEVSFK